MDSLIHPLPKRPSGNNGIKCSFYNKMGHKESDCWYKHSEKGPYRYKDKSDPGGVAVK